MRNATETNETSNLFQMLVNISRHIDSQVCYTGKHSARVADWVMFVTQKMGFEDSEMRSIYWAALLHDIGKVAIPAEVLSKCGPLTDEEWRLMKLHPTIGVNIVNSIPEVAHLAPFINGHQEKYNGEGYPDGLCGEEIPIGARILTVIDAYDAMTNDRYYRKAPGYDYAIGELTDKRNDHFDPEVVDVFLEVVQEFHH